MRVDLVLKRLKFCGFLAVFTLGKLYLKVVVFQKYTDNILQDLGVHILFSRRNQGLMVFGLVKPFHYLMELMVAVKGQYVEMCIRDRKRTGGYGIGTIL